MFSLEKHPKIVLTVFLFVFLFILAGLSEIALRFFVPYDIGYYSAVQKQGKYEYPYGTVYMNKDGYPDTEFDLASTKKRIGYFGDSVTFGVGAGAEYRFSNLIEKKHPKFEHWTFGMIANGIQDDDLLDTAKRYKLNTVVYAFNLNDILPQIENTEKETPKKKPLLFQIGNWVRNNLDGLRGRSYLYTSLRTSIKNLLTRLGYNHTGFKAVELFPNENLGLIKEVAHRINAMERSLKGENIKFCILLLPYEMQISKAAQETYKSLGITWEEGFEEGSTQKLLKKNLKTRYLYDGLNAFKGLKDTAQTGEYFVYNKGDKIDFNHPNRKGHALLAHKFIQSRACLFLR